MQYIVKTIAACLIFTAPLTVLAQSTLLPQGDKHAVLLDRLEIKRYVQPVTYTLLDKPYNRKTVTQYVALLDSTINAGDSVSARYSAVDRYNMTSFLMNNSEWVTGDKTAFASKKSIFTFYKTKANLLEVNEKDFFLAVNPVIQQQQSVESDNTDERIFLNSKGLTARGLIANKIGFSVYITDNQERAPRFVQERINSYNAVPGVGFYKPFKKTATDYLDARGTVHFNAAKYLDFQFGYDKNFVGNGYRSLLLSDFSNSYLFLKINTRIWKLNYMNLFMELTPQTVNINSGDKLLDRKYMAMHHLSIQAAKWLNVGIFEAVVFGRKNHFDFTYLNPVIFLRLAEQQNGSADNAIVGIDFKANVAHRLQFYGQWALDEFLLKEIRAGNGWWANKFGVQLGAKYIDVLNIKNLDIQGELNLVRPFTYSHSDSIANYTHYNQPLAHPLGANFIEAIGIIRYQPHPKWTTSARLIVWKQGVDTGSTNYGTNIFAPNTSRSMDYGFTLPTGPRTTGINAQLLVSYEVKENIFLEGSALLRNWKRDDNAVASRNTSVITAGIRMNMFRREYDY